jgi:lipopolysaccharide transport system ATP-binding protein
MPSPIISVEHLGKKYAISHQTRRPRQYRRLSEELVAAVSSSFRRLRPAASRTPKHQDFWALRDVSFEVQRGEAIGIIGHNGAGKSTLLKILSRITEPTAGRVTLRGRVASLLEVGTGFHPELTGTENIYLNGAILGMSRAEIKRKFDGIVAFADVDGFLDTPVKRYSSGMAVRLAFSVAAHLEPEILVIDEVLAVGDEKFQKKCLGKMSEIANIGRTVLFVSHNMGLVRKLCNRTVILERGQVKQIGPSEAVIPTYLATSAPGSRFERPPGMTSDVAIRRAAVQVIEAQDDHSLAVTVEIASSAEKRVNIDLRITDAFGVPIGFAAVGSFNHAHEVLVRPGLTSVKSIHCVNMLATGSYAISIDLGDAAIAYLDRVDHCLTFDVHTPPRDGTYRRLHQKWGLGSVELPYRAHFVSYLDELANGHRAQAD